MELLNKHKLTMAGVILGTLAGYLYYHFIGCTSGTCPITSNPTASSLYGALLGALLFSTFKTNHKTATTMNIESMIKTPGVKIIDVRSPGEFMSGHVAGAINIPLQTIDKEVEKIKGFNAPVILCCASGNRSGQAAGYLKSLGIDCVNGGAWTEVNYLLRNN